MNNLHKNIRNFCIIAHVNHGKSTLAYKLIKTILSVNNDNDIYNILDNTIVEKEKKITITNHTIQMDYLYNNKMYKLNLIDTPGHIDFYNEVLKSITVCEGAILLIDASKNIQSQTINNFEIAKKNNLSIIPVINKIDIKNININNVIINIKKKLNFIEDDIIHISAKYNIGIKKIINSIIYNIPYPNIEINNSLKAIIFGIFHKKYKRIEIHCKVLSGKIYYNQKIFISSLKNIEIKIYEIGNIELKNSPKKYIITGNIGYIIIRKVKNFSLIKIGDIIYNTNKNINNNNTNLNNNNIILPMIFSNLYPYNILELNKFKKIINNIHMNDNSFTITEINSIVFGIGFKCGFSGILHMETILERLYKEYKIKIYTTISNVTYKVYLSNKKIIYTYDVNKIVKFNNIIKIKEPIMLGNIICPIYNVGKIIELCYKKRSIIKNINYVKNKKSTIVIEIPFMEILCNFYSKLKIITKGYNKFNYKFLKYKKTNLVIGTIFINYKLINDLSFIIHKDKSLYFIKKICNNLSHVISRKLFNIPIQGAINNKVVFRKNIKNIRKNVISKCYGGDISRKKKLIKKQNLGKKKIKKSCNIYISKSKIIDIMNNNII